MPQTLNQLTIFVSGPSNVDAEKTALRTVVEKINGLFEKTRGITLRVVGWPNDLRPGVNSDPQSEIGYQVGTDYDIYVGILGSRFGSETIQAGSGTEEEFDGALSRFRGDSTAIRVLIYFKKEPDEDIFSIDPSQLQKVHDFRQRLGERGVLYRDFRDTGEFTEMVRQHLESLITEEWEDRKWSQKCLLAHQTIPPLQRKKNLPLVIYILKTMNPVYLNIRKLIWKHQKPLVKLWTRSPKLRKRWENRS